MGKLIVIVFAVFLLTACSAPAAPTPILSATQVVAVTTSTSLPTTLPTATVIPATSTTAATITSSLADMATATAMRALAGIRKPINVGALMDVVKRAVTNPR